MFPPGHVGASPRTSAHVLVAMLDVEVDLVGDPGTLGSLDGLRAEERGDRDEEETEGEPTEEHGWWWGEEREMRWLRDRYAAPSSSRRGDSLAGRTRATPFACAHHSPTQPHGRRYIWSAVYVELNDA